MKPVLWCLFSFDKSSPFTQSAAIAIDSKLSILDIFTSPLGWYSAVEHVNLYSVKGTFHNHWGLGALEIWNALFSIWGWWEEATGAEERLEHPAKGWVRLAGRPGTQNSGAACEIIFWVDTGVMGHFEVRVKPESAHFLFEAKVIDSLADFPGCWLNKELPLPWNSMLGY